MLHKLCLSATQLPVMSKSYISPLDPINSNRNRQTLLKKAEIENRKYIPFNIDTLTFIQNHPFVLGSER